MQFSSFTDLQKRLQELYQKKQFSVALDLATSQFEHFPEDKILLYYWRITLSAQTGDIPKSLRLLREAQASGIWYGEALLRKSPSLELVQGLPDFEKLMKLNQELAQKDRHEAFPLLTMRPEGCCQKGGPACPLLLALHANDTNAQGTMGFWKPAATAGWLVAALQSTQAVWKGAYVWNDREITEREVRKHYSILRDRYSIDPHRTVLAGHSAGGEAAIWLALKGVVETVGFIAISPGGPLMDDPNIWELLIQENLNGNLRGYIIIGEKDTEISLSNLQKFVERFTLADILCELEIIPGAGHDLVPQHDAIFLRALDFLSI